MFKNYMWSRFLMEKADDGGSGSGSGESDGDVAIDWSKVDVAAIPEDVVKRAPAFIKVLNEAATRRKENTQLKKQVEASVKNVETDEDTDVQEKPENKKTDSEEMPEWAKKLQTSLDSMTTDRIVGWRKEAAETYGLKGKAVERLQGNTRDELFSDAKTLSEELGIPKPTLNSSIGNVTQTRDKAKLEAVKARMRGGRGGNSNLFSPEAQSALGGGIIIDE